MSKVRGDQPEQAAVDTDSTAAGTTPRVSGVVPRAKHDSAQHPSTSGLAPHWDGVGPLKAAFARSRVPYPVSLPPPSSKSPISLDEELLEQMHRCFAEHAGPSSQITLPKLQRSLDIQDAFLAERVLAIFDRNRDGFVCRVEFLHNAPRLMFGSLLDKLRFAFRLHDLNSDGAIDRDELTRMIRLGLTEDGVRASNADVQRFTDLLLGAADTNQDGLISFREFERIAKEHPQVVDLIARSEASWIAPEVELPSDERAEKTRLQRGLRFVDNHVSPLLVVAFWALANVALFVSAALTYQQQGSNTFIQVARGAGACLNFNGALILVPMARHLLTWVRRTPVLRALPVDDAVSFHRLVGNTLFGLGLVHTLAHLANYAGTPQGVWAALSGSLAGATGLSLSIVFAVIWFCSRPAMRGAGRFELFHNTHLLYPVWFGLILLHGPVFWMWAGVPLVGFAIDRALRWPTSNTKAPVTETAALASGVTKLSIKKPEGFAHAAGDYLYLKLPALARHEWHPFTISSAPERPELTLHVRSLGDFTGALHQLALRRQASGDNSPLEAYVDGPFGTASGHIFESRHAVLIGAGIGVTPFASVLESIVLRHQAGRGALKKAYFFWLNRDAKAFEWFAELLSDLERTDHDQLVDIRIFMTSGRGNITATALNLARELAHALGDADLVTGLRAKTNMGAPDWRRELRQIVEAHHPEPVDVFFCGPPGLGRVIRRICSQLDVRFRQEHF